MLERFLMSSCKMCDIRFGWVCLFVCFLRRSEQDVLILSVNFCPCNLQKDLRIFRQQKGLVGVSDMIFQCL